MEMECAREESGEAFSMCADFDDEDAGPTLAPPPRRGAVQASRQQQRPVSLPPRVEYLPEELERARAMIKGHLDLVFLVDETGSMGAYIGQVKAHLLALVDALRLSPLLKSLRMGLVTYRDHPPQEHTFVTRVVPLTDDIDEIRSGVNQMQAHGGGDGPEAVTDGLHDLLGLNWDSLAARLVVMVGDAPPHGVEPHGDGFPEGCPCGRHWYVQAESCREMGIAVHTIGCQGLHSFVQAAAVFRMVAATTGGLYLPLDNAQLLIGVVAGLADRELDRQALRKQVEQVVLSHVEQLQLADLPEQVRFVSETLQSRKLRVLDLPEMQGGQVPIPTFRQLRPSDVEAMVEDALMNLADS